MRTVLVVTYYFPPVNGSGVHRAWALARYLPIYGYQPIVLTPGIEWHPSPVRQLEQGGATGTRVYRTQPDIPLRLTRALRKARAGRLQKVARILDVRGAWVHSALKLARRIISSQRVDAIFTSAPPYAIALVGYMLRRETGLPWVADMRDPWALSTSQPWLGGVGYWLDRTVQSLVMSAADRVVLNTPTCLREVLRVRPVAGSRRSVCITNGFQSPNGAATMPSGGARLRIAHVGMFYSDARDAPDRANIWRRIARTLSYSGDSVDAYPQSAAFLLQGLRLAIDRHPELGSAVDLTLVGAVHPVDLVLIRELGLDKNVTTTGQVASEEALRQMRSADVLYFSLERSRSGKPIFRIPSKIYEYVASCKPVLSVSGPGDARDILQKAGVGILCPETTPSCLADKIWELYQEHRSGGIRINPDRAFIDQFRWDRVVGRVARILDSVTESRSQERCMPACDPA